jgi:hypothetical protein
LYLAIVILKAFLHDLGESSFWPLSLQPQQEVEELVERLMVRNRELRQSYDATLIQQYFEDIFFRGK